MIEQSGHFEIRAVSPYTWATWFVLAVIAVHVFAMAYLFLRYRRARKRRAGSWLK